MENNANMENFSAELAFIPLFNLALQQNALPVIYELKLINNTDKTIENLNCIFLTILSSPFITRGIISTK